MLYNFANHIQIGDLILAKRGRNKLIGLGEVTGEYEYDTDYGEHHHVIGCKWIQSKEVALPKDLTLPMQTLTQITSQQNLLGFIKTEFNLISDGDSEDEIEIDSNDEDETDDAYDICYCLDYAEGGAEQIAREWTAKLPHDDVEKAIEILSSKFKSAVSYGPQQTVEFHNSTDENERGQQANRAFFLVEDLLKRLV